MNRPTLSRTTLRSPDETRFAPNDLEEETFDLNLLFSAIELPLRLRLERAMTDEELIRFSSDNEPLRVEREADGELTVMPPGGSEEGGLEAQVSLQLGVWARMDGRGKVFSSSAGFRLADSSVRAADVAWVSRVRWSALTGEQQDSFAPLCPEFVIEIRSETERLTTLERKMLQWIANGAEVAWLIDPRRKVVAIYRPGCEVEVHEDPTSVQGDGPVRGFELVMARVWG